MEQLLPATVARGVCVCVCDLRREFALFTATNKYMGTSRAKVLQATARRVVKDTVDTIKCSDDRVLEESTLSSGYP